jgi:hypothetical protein
MPASGAATTGKQSALSAAIASRATLVPPPPHPLEISSNTENEAHEERPAASGPSGASLPGMSLARVLQQSLQNSNEGHRVVALRHVEQAKEQALPAENILLHPPRPSFETDALDWPPLLRRVTPATEAKDLVRELNHSPWAAAPSEVTAANAGDHEERPLSRAMRRCKM